MTPDFLILGGIQDGKVWLSGLKAAPEKAAV
jgi:hypothetical protein